jgi:oligopeptide transport system substrate-binding protein
LVPRGVRGFIPDMCSKCSFDQEGARATLSAKFNGKLPSIRIDHLGDQTSRLVARAIANDLNAVGFHTSLQAHGADEYLKLLQRKGQDFAELGWVAVTPTPDGFLAQQLRNGSSNNQTGFHDPSFDAAIDRARKERDDAKRLADYAGAEKRALELMPMIPIVFYRNREAVSSRVHGFVLDGAGVFDAAAIWLR